MQKDFINIHGPEHHFLDGACFLVAYKNAGGNINIEEALNLLAERTIKMPGALKTSYKIVRDINEKYNIKKVEVY